MKVDIKMSPVLHETCTDTMSVLMQALCYVIVKYSHAERDIDYSCERVSHSFTVE